MRLHGQRRGALRLGTSGGSASLGWLSGTMAWATCRTSRRVPRYQRRARLSGRAARHYEHTYRTLSTGECLLCIEELSAKARAAWYRPDGINEALAIMRKIAAVAVQAMENHGVIPR
jgi:hypothetical protein